MNKMAARNTRLFPPCENLVWQILSLQERFEIKAGLLAAIHLQKRLKNQCGALNAK